MLNVARDLCMMALIATCHERAELIIVTGVGLTEQSTSTETNGYSDILSCIGLKRTQEMEVSNTTMATACGRSYWYIPCIQGRSRWWLVVTKAPTELTAE